MHIHVLTSRPSLRRLVWGALLAALLTACAANEVKGHGAEHRAPPPPGPWVLMALLEHNQVPATRITLATAAEGRLSGEAGCNRWAGQWLWTDAGVSLAPVATTRKICPPEIMELEQRFLDALARTDAWQMTDRGLMLLDAARNGLLLFSLAEPPR